MARPITGRAILFSTAEQLGLDAALLACFAATFCATALDLDVTPACFSA